MAPKNSNVTSSATRSRRSSTMPVTKGQNPQRANRQRVSNASVSSSESRAANTGARVTNSSQRTNTGSAPVTGSARPSLPPGRRGGAMTPAPKAGSMSNPPSTPVRVRDLGSGKPPSLPGGTGGADTVRGSGVRTGQPGATRLALPPGSAAQAEAAAASGLRGRLANGARSLVNQKARAIGAGSSIVGSVLSGDAKGAAITGGTYAAGRLLQAAPHPAAKLAGKVIEAAAPFAPAAADALSSIKLPPASGGRFGNGGRPTNTSTSGSGRPPSRFADARQKNLDRINNDPRFKDPSSRQDNSASLRISSPSRSSSGSGSVSRSASSSSQRPSQPAQPLQSKNMDENYAAWTKANKKLAEKVKPGQAGYEAIQKALGKTKSK